MVARQLSLLCLAGCSLVGSLKGETGRSTHAAAGQHATDAAKPKVDDDDPPHVARAIERLDKMQQLITEKRWAEYARESRDFNGIFMFHDGWSGEKKRDAMRARLDALDAAAFKAFGGRLAPLVGDAKRVTKLDADAVEAGAAAVDACHRAAGMSTTGTGEAAGKLASAIAAYEKQLQRAAKMEPQVFHYFGEAPKSGTIDIPTALMECEVDLVAADTQFADEYAPEVVPKTETERGCGTVDFLIDGVQIGSGTFAPYSRTAGGASFAERIACGKFPKRSNYPKAMAAAVREYAENEGMKVSDLVIVVRDRPYIEEDDEDARLHRYQKLTAYSKKFEFAKNPCGDGKLFCEAGGSRTAGGFNRAEHAMARAAVHAGTDPELCKKHLKEAKSQAEWFAGFYADAVKSKSWVAGATYKTKQGKLLKEKELIAAFEQIGQDADEKLDNRYCSKPSK